MAVSQLKQTATEARLAVMQMPSASGWMAEARAGAEARLRQMGLSHRRDEYWKFTRPDGLVQPVAPVAAVFEDASVLWADIDRLKIVFVDGVFDADASDDLSGENLSVCRLSEVAQSDIHWVKDIYGALEAHGQSVVERPLAALNTAYATDGICVHATGKVSRPVELIYRQKSNSSDAILHHCMKVENGAELTVLETGPAAARFNTVMEVDVADEAAFHHVRIQGRDHERHAVTGMFARLGRESTFKSFTLTMNGVMTRNEAVLDLTGDDAVAHVAGVCVGDGGDFHHDDTVFVTHDAVNCESRQVFKKVLRNGATGVFQGKILVQPDAQKTDGYQISQSLLLDDDSQFLAKPELEIYADDVACSHGSTTGAIDEEALYYLRSRGVPEGEATDLLVLAFLAEALEEIEDEALSESIYQLLEAWLSRQAV